MTFPRRFNQLKIKTVLAVSVGMALLASPGAARAQDRVAVDKVTQLNKKAIEAYENLDFEDARKLLKQALDLCATSGMETHKLKARTHVHMGIVFVGGFKQREQGVKQFKKALEIQPDISLTKSLVNPDIQGAFDEAKSGGGGETTSVPPTPPPPPEPVGPRLTPPDNLSGLYHDLVNEGARGQAVEVRVAVGNDVEFDKVMLAYRPKGASDYLAREMAKNEKGWYTAEIPAAATASDVVAYYIEVRNKGGQPVLANGSAREPNLVALSEEAPPKSKKRKKQVDEDGQEVAADDGGDEDEDKPVRKKKKKKKEDDEESTGHSIFLSLGLGSGAGWTQGKPELNPKDVNGQDILIQPGVALAGLMHFAPEVGFYLAPDFILSVQGRIQLVKGTTPVEAWDCGGNNKLASCPPAGGALAVFAKATWLFGEDTKFHPYFNVSVGGGSIRHIVNLSPADVPGCNDPYDPMSPPPGSKTKGFPMDETPGECKDTVRGGVFLTGPGGGFMYDLSPSAAFVAGANAQVGMSEFTINLDLNLGFALSM